MEKENNQNILYCFADESSKPYEKGENPYPWTKEDEDFTNRLAREIEFQATPELSGQDAATVIQQVEKMPSEKAIKKNKMLQGILQDIYTT